MAVPVYDNITTVVDADGGVAPRSLTCHAASGSDRGLVLYAGWIGQSADTTNVLNTPTYDSNNMTLVGHTSIVVGARSFHLAIYAYIAPATSTKTIAWTYTVDDADIIRQAFNAVTYTGCHQTDMVGASAFDNNATGDPTDNITTTESDSLIGAACMVRHRDAEPFADVTNQTERWDYDTEGGTTASDAGCSGADRDATTAQEYTISFDPSRQDDWVIGMVEILSPSSGSTIALTLSTGGSATTTLNVSRLVPMTMSSAGQSTTSLNIGLAVYLSMSSAGVTTTSLKISKTLEMSMSSAGQSTWAVDMYRLLGLSTQADAVATTAFNLANLINFSVSSAGQSTTAFNLANLVRLSTQSDGQTTAVQNFQLTLPLSLSSAGVLTTALNLSIAGAPDTIDLSMTVGVQSGTAYNLSKLTRLGFSSAGQSGQALDLHRLIGMGLASGGNSTSALALSRLVGMTLASAGISTTDANMSLLISLATSIAGQSGVSLDMAVLQAVSMVLLGSVYNYRTSGNIYNRRTTGSVKTLGDLSVRV